MFAVPSHIGLPSSSCSRVELISGWPGFPLGVPLSVADDLWHVPSLSTGLVFNCITRSWCTWAHSKSFYATWNNNLKFSLTVQTYFHLDQMFTDTSITLIFNEIRWTGCFGTNNKPQFIFDRFRRIISLYFLTNTTSASLKLPIVFVYFFYHAIPCSFSLSSHRSLNHLRLQPCCCFTSALSFLFYFHLHSRRHLHSFIPLFK